MSLRPRLQLTLLDNGLDFIREGVEVLYGDHGSKPPRAYKYALLHLFSGALLVLKERLRKAHGSLIFKDVAKSGRPGAPTVDFDEVIARLEGAANVKLDREAKDLLRKIQVKRNELEHYGAQLEVTEADTLVGELVEFLERFLHEELQESIFNHVSPTAGQQISELAKVAQRLRERRHEAWLKRAALFEDLSDEQLAELAREGEYHPRDNPDARIFACPECGGDSVVGVDRDIGVCTNEGCRALHELEDCSRCGSTAILSGTIFCDDCDGYIRHEMSRED